MVKNFVAFMLLQLIYCPFHAYGDDTNPYAPPGVIAEPNDHRELPAFDWTAEYFAAALKAIEQEVLTATTSDTAMIARVVNLTASLALMIRSESAPFRGFDPSNTQHVLNMATMGAETIYKSQARKPSKTGKDNYFRFVSSSIDTKKEPRTSAIGPLLYYMDIGNLAKIHIGDPENQWAKLVNRTLIHKASYEAREVKFFNLHRKKAEKFHRIAMPLFIPVVGGMLISIFAFHDSVAGQMTVSISTTLPFFTFSFLADHYYEKAETYRDAAIAEQIEESAREKAKKLGYPWVNEKLIFPSFELMGCKIGF